MKIKNFILFSIVFLNILVFKPSSAFSNDFKENEGIPVQFEGWIEGDEHSGKSKSVSYIVEMPLEIDLKKSSSNIQFERYLKDPVFISGFIVLTKSGKPLLRVTKISSKKLNPVQEPSSGFDYVEEEDLDYLNSEFQPLKSEKISKEKK
jgi:hypothetical protein